MKTRVIICAAGSPERWGNYLGLPKQYIHFRGVPLLQRTIDQARGFGARDVLVTAAVPPPDGITITGAEFVKPNPALSPMGDSGSGCSFQFWTKDPETCNVILCGDVYYSPFCMENVFLSAAGYIVGGASDLHYFGRRGGGWNGKGWGEIFAWFVRSGEARGAWSEAVSCVQWRKRQGDRITSWEILDYLEDRKDYYWTEIRDATEDFDRPRDLDSWAKRYPDLWAPLKG